MFILFVVLLVRFSRLQITKPGAPAGNRLMGDRNRFITQVHPRKSLAGAAVGAVVGAVFGNGAGRNCRLVWYRVAHTYCRHVDDQACKVQTGFEINEQISNPVSAQHPATPSIIRRFVCHAALCSVVIGIYSAGKPRAGSIRSAARIGYRSVATAFARYAASA